MVRHNDAKAPVRLLSPVQGGWRGAWSNKDRNASRCPGLTAARCPGPPPKFDPSCAATPGPYCRDTYSLPGHACVSRHLLGSASLWGESRDDADRRRPPMGIGWCVRGSHPVCSSASPCSGHWWAGCCPGDAPLHWCRDSGQDSRRNG